MGAFELRPPLAAMVLLRYARRFSRLPQLSPPVTFSDHITHRLLYDRNPLLKTICDKIEVKSFLVDRVGVQHTVPLLGAWTRGSDIAWDNLPSAFMFKPSFLSGPFAYVTPGSDRGALSKSADEWLQHRPALRHYCEWGYIGLPRRVMAEELMVGEDGGQPAEANVHVFNGRAQLVRILTGRKLTGDRRDAWFDRHGRQLAIETCKVKPSREVVEEPILRELIDIAEAVAQGFSFMRVDVHIAKQGLAIGELSPYPWGGRACFKMSGIDEKMGALFAPEADTSAFSDYRE